MRTSMLIWSLVGILALVQVFAAHDGVRAALAQGSGSPPAVGEPFLIESLSSKGSFVFGECPTSRAAGTYQGDGAHVSINGKCYGNYPTASMFGLSTDVVLEDGEVSIDLRMLEGAERAAIGILVRGNVDGSGYWIGWAPALGQLYVRNGIFETSRLLGAQSGVRSTDPDGWLRMTVRMQGDLIWVLADERPVLAFLGSGSTRGNVGLMLVRFGDPDAEAPTEGLWKNFSVSALANGDKAKGPGKAFPPPASNARNGGRQPVAPAPAPRPAAPIGQPPAASGVPPAVGELALEDTLTQPGIVRSMPCPTGKQRSEVTPEGYRLSVSGRCAEQVDVSAMVYLAGVDVADGEIQLDFKAVAGQERAAVTLITRIGNPDERAAYTWPVVPQFGQGAIHLLDFAARRELTLSLRRDLATLLRPKDWNTVAIRHLGDQHWLLLNGVPVATATDPAASAGGVLIEVARAGNRDDDQEVAVVFRNLKISALAGTPDERLPVLTEPDEPPPTTPGMIVGRAGTTAPAQERAVSVAHRLR